MQEFVEFKCPGGEVAFIHPKDIVKIESVKCQDKEIKASIHLSTGEDTYIVEDVREAIEKVDNVYVQEHEEYLYG